MTIQEKTALIGLMRDAIVRASDPVRIILFGSYAAGTATQDSDADFLIVEDQPFGPQRSRRKEAARIWAALMPFEIAKDVLVYSRDEVNRAAANPLHVVAQALKTGKVLYERT
jgi:predicted nucleotidyltransferase